MLPHGTTSSPNRFEPAQWKLRIARLVQFLLCTSSKCLHVFHRGKRSSSVDWNNFPNCERRFRRGAGSIPHELDSHSHDRARARGRTAESGRSCTSPISSQPSSFAMAYKATQSPHAEDGTHTVCSLHRHSDPYRTGRIFSYPPQSHVVTTTAFALRGAALD
jgi:hypothetical protein